MLPIRRRAGGAERAARFDNRSGTTMVELIVTFALVCLFLLAGISMITSFYESYAQIRAADLAQEVSELILDQIAGQIAGAQKSAGGAAGSVVISDASDPVFGVTSDSDPSPHNCVSLRNSAGSSVYLTTTDFSPDPELDGGYLLIHYRPGYSESGDESETQRSDAVNWTFDKSVYLGFQITRLKFDRAEPGNVVKISLALRRDALNDTYEAVRYVQCYRFDPDEDADPVQYGVIPGDS